MKGFEARSCSDFFDYIAFKPKYKVTERVKYRVVDNNNKSKVYSSQIKRIELKQIRKQDEISYKLRYFTGRGWIEESQILDWDS